MSDRVRIIDGKLHHGRIVNWTKASLTKKGLGYVIFGKFLDHPRYTGIDGHTSYVVTHDEAMGEIETCNSRYTLVGKEGELFVEEPA